MSRERTTRHVTERETIVCASALVDIGVASRSTSRACLIMIITMDILAIASKAMNSVHGFSFLLFIVNTLQFLRDSLIGFKSIINLGFLERGFLIVAAFSEDGFVGAADLCNGGYAKHVRRFHHERK